MTDKEGISQSGRGSWRCGLLLSSQQSLTRARLTGSGIGTVRLGVGTVCIAVVRQFGGESNAKWQMANLSTDGPMYRTAAITPAHHPMLIRSSQILYS